MQFAKGLLTSVRRKPVKLDDEDSGLSSDLLRQIDTADEYREDDLE